jgi:hypothetical protein
VGAGGIRVIPGINDALALKRNLLDAVDGIGKRDARGLINGRCNIRHMMELAAQATRILDTGRPGDDQRIARSAKIRGVLLGSLERGRHGPCPGRHNVIVVERAAKLVGVCLQLLEVVLSAKPLGDVGIGALHAALRAGTVVADDVEDQSVVTLSFLVNGIQNSSHLCVGVGKKRRVDLGFVRENLLFFGGQRVPRGQAFRPCSQLRIGGNDTQFFLARKGLLAQLVPSLIELPLVFFIHSWGT